MNEHTTEVTPFDFKGNRVRVVIIEGDPWFVANDVAKILEYSNPHDALDQVPEQYLGKSEVLDGRGISRETNVVSERGMYRLVMRSNKPEAEDFQDWVYGVLESIRKTGRYEVARTLSPAELILQQAQQLVDMERRQEEQAKEISVVRDAVADIQDDMDDMRSRTGWMTTRAYVKTKLGMYLDNRRSVMFGTEAGKLLRAEGMEPGKVPDERHGSVNSYPIRVLEQAWTLKDWRDV